MSETSATGPLTGVRAAFRHMALATRLRLYGALSATIAVLATVLIHAGLEVYEHRGDARAAMRAAALAQAPLLAPALVAGDADSAGAALRALGTLPGVRSVVLRDARGAVRGRWPREPVDTDRPAARLQVPVTARDGTPLGRLQLEWTPSPAAAALAEESALMALGAVLGLLAAAALGVYLRRFIMAPVRRLVAVARRVTASGDYAIRAEVPTGGGEVAALADALNTLLERVQRHDHELEQQVAVRTDELMRLNEHFRHQAYHDPLTGLANRALFDDHLTLALANAERRGEQLAVMFMDLDGFKTVNDTLGHEFGDELLRRVARRLQRTVRRDDTVARLAGDEFTFILTSIGSPVDAARIAEAILTAVRKPVEIRGQQLRVSGSIGVTLFPHDGADASILKRNADAAMYFAKEQGRNNFQFYSSDLNLRTQRRLQMHSELQQAIDQGEFTVVFQPQVDAATGGVVKVEALVRWRHPERGMVPPGEFIPVAEDLGLVTAIDRWVLSDACLQVARWHRELGVAPGLSVNLSVQHFRSDEVVTAVRQALEVSGLDAASLELEITESGLMRNAEEAVAVLAELKRLGVRVAIDDFGTGYSALAYLRRFPVDTVKVDRSFIRDLTTDAGDAAIVQAIVAMCRSLQLELVAEGVETFAQVEALRRMECQLMQGYFFYRPLTSAELEELLAREAGAAGRLDSAS